jgi:pyruvate dehydrogenase E2 component (dihydrolipoamide acetyltransferase)
MIAKEEDGQVALFEYKFPELGEGIHEGEIVKLHIKPGDEVTDDDVIMDVQNDKAIVEVPCPVNGKIVEIKVKEGQLCHVGELVATIEVAGEAVQEGNKSTPAEEGSAPVIAATDDAAAPKELTDKQNPQTETPAAVVKDNAAASKTPEQEQTGAHPVLATPSVRKLAREKGLALTSVTASGKNGRITREDVLKSTEGGADGEAKVAAADPANQNPLKQGVKEESTEFMQAALTPAAKADSTAPEAQVERIPLKGIRKIIANAMVKSVYTAPHVTLMDEVNVSALVAFREKMKPIAEKKGIKLTYLPFIVKAMIAAARLYPVLNAEIDEEQSEIIYKKYYNIGIATDTEIGLLVPVIPEADRKNIWMLAAAIKDLAERGRAGKLASHELKGSTMTITNIGSAGGMFFTPVINFPEVAILGTGRITEKPIVSNGEIIAAHVMALSLSFDHRIIDGGTAQRFMNEIKQLLADPELFILEV